MADGSQQLILRLIERAFGEEYVLLRDGGYANTGVLRCLRADDLRQIASVTYDFQPRYCHFGPMTDRVAALWYDQPDVSGKAAWVKGTIPDLVETVVRHLKGEA